MYSDLASGILYIIIGLTIIYLFIDRRKRLSALTPEQLPGLDHETYKELIQLLKTIYERMLYLGVSFFPLALTSFRGSQNEAKFAFLLLILLLFVSNIFPRNKVMKFLYANKIFLDDLKKKGIKL